MSHDPPFSIEDAKFLLLMADPGLYEKKFPMYFRETASDVLLDKNKLEVILEAMEDDGLSTKTDPKKLQQVKDAIEAHSIAGFTPKDLLNIFTDYGALRFVYELMYGEISI